MIDFELEIIMDLLNEVVRLEIKTVIGAIKWYIVRPWPIVVTTVPKAGPLIYIDEKNS